MSEDIQLSNDYHKYVCPICHEESSVKSLGGGFFKLECGHVIQGRRDQWESYAEPKVI